MEKDIRLLRILFNFFPKTSPNFNFWATETTCGSLVKTLWKPIRKTTEAGFWINVS